MPHCKLCKEQKRLVDAHVIPRSFWNIPKQGNKPLAVFSNRQKWLPRRSPVGEYDNTILCAECEASLSDLDQHAFETLVKEKGLDLRGISPANGRVYDQANPKKIHDFICSVAWRASVSRRDFYNRVDLGPYEKILADSFAAGGHAINDLGAFIAEFDQPEVVFLNPQYSRMNGVKFLVIFANRFTFYLKVDRQPMPEMFKYFELCGDGPVRTIIRSWQNSKQLQAVIELARSNPKPKFW